MTVATMFSFIHLTIAAPVMPLSASQNWATPEFCFSHVPDAEQNPRLQMVPAVLSRRWSLAQSAPQL